MKKENQNDCGCLKISLGIIFSYRLVILLLQLNNRKDASWICMNPLGFINEQIWGNFLDPYTTENLKFEWYQEVEWKKKKCNIIRDYPSFELGGRTPQFWLFFLFHMYNGV